MGGGDLNLKKSWHPSTLRNVERVWKAEQLHEAERKKIQELQKELAEERAREEIKQYAQDQGVIANKKTDKMDWMYKGLAGQVNHEDYLLGKRVDKNFEAALEGDFKTASAYDGIPESIFSNKGNETIQVDLAAKLRDDPLYHLKKKEEDNLKLLLNNPIKLKKLKELYEKSKAKKRKEKKKYSSDEEKPVKSKKKKYEESSRKDKRKSRRDNSPSSEDERMNRGRRRSPEYKDQSSSYKFARRDSNSDSYRPSKPKMHREKRRNDSPERRQQPSSYRRNRHDSSSDSERHQKRSNSNSRSQSSSHRRARHSSSSDDGVQTKRTYRQPETKPYRPNNFKHDDKSKRDTYKSSKESDSRAKHQSKLDDEEKKRRLEEMMSNAKWRDETRLDRVKKFTKSEENELKTQYGKGKADFIAPMLSSAASNSSLEKQVKRNAFSIQRSGKDFESNFARR